MLSSLVQSMIDFNANHLGQELWLGLRQVAASALEGPPWSAI